MPHLWTEFSLSRAWIDPPLGSSSGSRWFFRRIAPSCFRSSRPTAGGNPPLSVVVLFFFCLPFSLLNSLCIRKCPVSCVMFRLFRGASMGRTSVAGSFVYCLSWIKALFEAVIGDFTCSRFNVLSAMMMVRMLSYFLPCGIFCVGRVPDWVHDLRRFRKGKKSRAVQKLDWEHDQRYVFGQMFLPRVPNNILHDRWMIPALCCIRCSDKPKIFFP